MQVFVGCAGVINLVKIGAVIPARFANAGIALVNQVGYRLRIIQHIGSFAGMRNNRHGQIFALHIPDDDFPQVQSCAFRVQPQVTACQSKGNAGIADASRVALGGLHCVIPAIAQPLPHFAGVILGPGLPILADSDGKVVIADARIVQHVKILALPQIKHNLLLT